MADIEGGRLTREVERDDPLLIARQVCETLRPTASSSDEADTAEEAPAPKRRAPRRKVEPAADEG